MTTVGSLHLLSTCLPGCLLSRSVRLPGCSLLASMRHSLFAVQSACHWDAPPSSCGTADGLLCFLPALAALADTMDDCFLEFDFEWHSKQVSMGEVRMALQLGLLAPSMQQQRARHLCWWGRLQKGSGHGASSWVLACLVKGMHCSPVACRSSAALGSQGRELHVKVLPYHPSS